MATIGLPWPAPGLHAAPQMNDELMNDELAPSPGPLRRQPQPQAKSAPIRHNTLLCVATAADLTYPRQRQNGGSRMSRVGVPAPRREWWTSGKRPRGYRPDRHALAC